MLRKPSVTTNGFGGDIRHPSNIGPLLGFLVTLTLCVGTAVAAIVIGKGWLS